MIVPRWEWRTFGDRFGAAEEVLAGSSPTGVEETDELYLLSQDGDNVKIRADLMDIKALRAVDRHGLQQWEPVLKAAFPLTAADVATTFEALRQPLPTPAGAGHLAGGARRRCSSSPAPPSGWCPCTSAGSGTCSTGAWSS